MGGGRQKEEIGDICNIVNKRRREREKIPDLSKSIHFSQHAPKCILLHWKK